MKIACLFAGQGAQYPGMGRDLYERYPKSRQVFDAAGDRIKNLCFEGTAEELKLTENTQPCVYAVTMAAYEEFISRFEAEKPEDAEIAAMAGFSLGEYAALTAAGVIADIADGDDISVADQHGRFESAAFNIYLCVFDNSIHDFFLRIYLSPLHAAAKVNILCIRAARSALAVRRERETGTAFLLMVKTPQRPISSALES